MIRLPENCADGDILNARLCLGRLWTERQFSYGAVESFGTLARLACKSFSVFYRLVTLPLPRSAHPHRNHLAGSLVHLAG